VTDKVDYRDDEESYVVVSDIPDDQLQKVKKVMKKVGLNFTAADFMIDEENKHWFLEVNTLPMFAAFDVVVNGTLAKTIRDELDLI
jgi:D-alanine-D-alanine ligase-like ATP-grasp enzyme